MVGQLNILRQCLFTAVIAAACWLPAPLVAEARLIMVEEPGCIWCARWNKAIGPIYPKTPEGQAAPLQRIDIRDATPDDLTFDSALRFTPTFVLVQDGVEVARIEGYPGEDFFWGLLQRMLEDAGIDYNEAENS